MSETPAPRRVLHLVVEGFPADKLAKFSVTTPGTSDVVEVFPLTEASASTALEKIFAADTVAVWGKV
jgi:hypothetical protein